MQYLLTAGGVIGVNGALVQTPVARDCRKEGGDVTVLPLQTVVRVVKGAMKKSESAMFRTAQVSRHM